MKKFAMFLAVLFLTTAAWCQDVTMSDTTTVETGKLGWAITGLGSDENALVRVGLLGERTEVGLEGGWLDGLTPDSEEGWLGGFYGKYNLIDNAPLQIGTWQIETDWYIGVRGGVLFPEGEGVDAYGGAMTGLAFGDDTQQIGAEFQYDLTSKLWQQFADREDTWTVVGFVALKFQ